MIVKVHPAYRYIVAICDSELLGCRFEEGNMQLDLTGQFFKGEEKTDEEVREIIEDMRKEDASFNIVGEKACRLALEAELIDQSGISRVDSVPVALVLL